MQRRGRTANRSALQQSHALLLAGPLLLLLLLSGAAGPAAGQALDASAGSSGSGSCVLSDAALAGVNWPPNLPCGEDVRGRETEGRRRLQHVQREGKGMHVDNVDVQKETKKELHPWA